MSKLFFTLRRDIVNYRDIQLLFFFNRERCQFFMNVYSDSFHNAMNFLSNKALNIHYMEDDFNIRDAKWNLFVFSHSAAG